MRSLFRYRFAAAATAALALTACQSGTPGPAAGSATAATQSRPTTTAPAVPGEPVGERLREQLAGNSASGPASCSYYGTDGTLVRASGGAAQAGTWSVDGRFVCETVGGQEPACFTMDFLPLGAATVTPATGSSIPAQSVEISPGNRCG